MELEAHRMLSIQTSHIHTISSDAQTHAAAPDHEALGHENCYRKIGAGACGAIFGVDGDSTVFKLAKADQESLWNDFRIHKLIAEKFCKWRAWKWKYTVVKVPACHYFVPKNEALYFEKNSKLVEAAKDTCNLPTSALITERIQPLPKRACTLLIEKYCPPPAKEAALSDPANKDCLVRVYLGSMKGRQGRFFSLRNFKMHLNQLVELQLDIKQMAGKMATAMALMHWAAKTDGRDVEFVLGSSSVKSLVEMSAEDYLNLPGPIYTGPPSRIHEDLFIRNTDLWLLDFNQVQQITMDEAGVAMAVEAVKLNDPYIPKPLQESDMEKQLWNEFVEQYLVSAHDILREEPDYEELFDLPALFISGVIELERKRQEKKEIMCVL
jgi:hypothetical protein